MKPFSQLLAQYQADIEIKHNGKSQVLSRADSELIDASVRINSDPPSPNDFTFIHSIMCQIGLPRSRVNGVEFERRCGAAGLYVRAGKIWDGKQFVQQPVPYGPMPRLVMAYLNTQALRSKSPEIDVGSSARGFLKQLGKDSSGGKTEAIQTSVNRLWRCLLVVLRLVLVLLTKRSLTMVSQSKNLRLGLVTMIIKVLYGPVLLHFLRSTSRR